MSKVTIYGPPEDWGLAVRAARLLGDRPDNHILFENGVTASAKRNKAGITVWLGKSDHLPKEWAT